MSSRRQFGKWISQSQFSYQLLRAEKGFSETFCSKTWVLLNSFKSFLTLIPELRACTDFSVRDIHTHTYAGTFFFFFFFSFPQEHSSSVFITLYLRLVGGKRTVDTTSPLLTSNTLLQSWTWCIYNIQYHQRKEYFIEKMYPGECERA